MSRSSTERDQQLLSIGHQCSEATCMLIDFLPIECQHCAKPFCTNHFLPASHKCDKYDESKYNRVAPSCPLCNVPIAIPPGQDPNIRMERHFNEECSVMTGKSGKARSSPICAKGKCGKVLFQPIRCSDCQQQYCPAHRFPATHDCSPLNSSTSAATSRGHFNPIFASHHQTLAASASSAVASIKRTLAAPNATRATSSSSSKLHDTKLKPKPSSNAASASSADASIKRTLAATGATSSSPSSPHDTNPKSKPSSNPFSKTDRRAKDERESRISAMQARDRKGLLRDDEKALLASLEAERSSDKDCVIM
ncbi:hypothetical protein HETIRDRAFT_147684 [Heterobasidion irregulare TC 32-1]|uniref:AN1-type domain-containing protein n=1 Tax=Heterobasidion irregulare (strain TC 32-1) TaxID=747525 RepID=W4K8N6_HETIT|nr:uncharacterized protein HETIRDRAFT_147684 [Heterobasidion irregulare TC 32-1]ETW81710.1 hypothetical protein HETIRDRAFT_147684 [Heterobasidion irregulare TC 32-1]